MRRFLVIIGLFVIFLLILVVFVLVQDGRGGIQFAKVKIGLAVFDAEVANTPLLQTKGLAERSSIPKNYGMLFIFEKPEIKRFWMKGVKFPLDIVWIRGDKVVGIVYGVDPLPEAVDDENEDSPTIYESPEPVDKVLEVNAGEIVNYGIKVGDLIDISY